MCSCFWNLLDIHNNLILSQECWESDFLKESQIPIFWGSFDYPSVIQRGDGRSPIDGTLNGLSRWNGGHQKLCWSLILQFWWKKHQTHRPQSMENLLLRVQANVAKEFEVEKDVAPWQKNGWALIWVWITIKALEDHRWFSLCLALIIRFLGCAILTHIHLSLRFLVLIVV